MEALPKISIQESDIVAFPHPNRDSEKPEIIKAEYILEVLSEILDSSDIESLINQRLENKNINLVTEYKEYSGYGNNYHRHRQYWSQKGLKCEFARMGDRYWQKGRFRININFDCEFIPDDEEAEIDRNEIASDELSLDKIRGKIAEE